MADESLHGLISRIQKNLHKARKLTGDTIIPTYDGEVSVPIRKQFSSAIEDFLTWLNMNFDCSENWLSKMTEILACWTNDESPEDILDLTSILVLRPPINAISSQANQPTKTNQSDSHQSEKDAVDIENAPKNYRLDVLEKNIQADIEMFFKLANKAMAKHHKRLQITKCFIRWISWMFECNQNWVEVMLNLVDSWEYGGKSHELFQFTTVLVVRKPLSKAPQQQECGYVSGQKRSLSLTQKENIPASDSKRKKIEDIPPAKAGFENVTADRTNKKLDFPAAFETRIRLAASISNYIQSKKNKTCVIKGANNIMHSASVEKKKKKKKKILVVLGIENKKLEGVVIANDIFYDLSFKPMKNQLFSGKTQHVGIYDTESSRKWFTNLKKKAFQSN